MDPTHLLTSLVGGVFGARGKRHTKAERFLGGGSGKLWNAKTILTAGALGWAAYEIWRTRDGGQRAGAPQAAVVPGTVVVPSAPPAGASTQRPDPPPMPPPLPGQGAGAIPPVRRLVGVLLAAARCDGTLGEDEYGRILRSAREAGGEALVGEELRNPTPLAALAGGIPEPAAREDLYRLAYGVVRADEDLNAAERTWLSQLAAALGLDAATSARLEREVAQGIAATA